MRKVPDHAEKKKKKKKKELTSGESASQVCFDQERNTETLSASVMNYRSFYRSFCWPPLDFFWTLPRGRTRDARTRAAMPAPCAPPSMPPRRLI